jgi:hypothetical protein
MVPAKLKSLTSPGRSASALCAAVDFLTMLWGDYDRSSYTFLSTKWDDDWRDHSISGDRAAQIVKLLKKYPPEQFDVYFCPNAFAEPRRLRVHALPSRYAWCDIDGADPHGYDPRPNILWRTSPGHFQGIWIWDRTYPSEIAEQYSHNIVDKDGGDANGWSITKALRLPGTVNHKPQYQKPQVTLRAFDLRPQWVPATIQNIRPRAVITSSGAINIVGLDAKKIMRRYRPRMTLRAGTLMTATRVLPGLQRHKVVFAIIACMIEVGASDSEIAAMLLENPYFIDKWEADLAEAERQILKIRADLEAGR